MYCRNDHEHCGNMNCTSSYNFELVSNMSRNSMYLAVSPLWFIYHNFKLLFAHTTCHAGQPEQVASMFGWPFSRNCLPSYHLKPASDPAYQRVLTALSYANPHISSCPLLPPLLHVMLHFIEEYECFAALHHLLQRKAWLDQDARQVQASIATLRALAYSHIVSHTQNFVLLFCFIRLSPIH